MSETKFTPGPWGPREGRIDTGVIVGGPMRAFRNGSTQCQIALACLSESVDENTRRANAALIAAAPDLYEALRSVNKLIGEAAMTGFNWQDGDWAQRLFDSQQETSRALSKAVAREASRSPQAPADSSVGD